MMAVVQDVNSGGGNDLGRRLGGGILKESVEGGLYRDRDGIVCLGGDELEGGGGIRGG